MGLDLDIITDTNELVDRYSIKWLYYYDYESFLNWFNTNKNTINAILYCDKQIIKLEEKINKFQKIEKINYLEFNEKKEYLISLINNTNSDEEINGLIKKIHMVIYENKDFNYLKNILEHFKSFKLFLEKYQGYKCEISC